MEDRPMVDTRTPIDPDTPIPDTKPEPKDRIEVREIPGSPVENLGIPAGEHARPTEPQETPLRGGTRTGSAIAATEDGTDRSQPAPPDAPVPWERPDRTLTAGDQTTPTLPHESQVAPTNVPVTDEDGHVLHARTRRAGTATPRTP
jgi:hypothetical protein